MILEIYLLGVVITGIVADQLFKNLKYRQFIYDLIDLEHEEDFQPGGKLDWVENGYNSREEMYQDLFKKFIIFNIIGRSILSWIGLILVLITYIWFKIAN